MTPAEAKVGAILSLIVAMFLATVSAWLGLFVIAIWAGTVQIEIEKLIWENIELKKQLEAKRFFAPSSPADGDDVPTLTEEI